MASAITAGLVKGKDVVTSVKEAKEFIGHAIMGAVISGKGAPQAEPLTRLYQDSERYDISQRVLRAVEVLKKH